MFRNNFAVSIILYGTFIIGCNGNSAPYFTSSMALEDIDENTPVGSSLYQLRGGDDDGDPLTYGIISDYFEVRNPQNGIVYLTQPLNYEVTPRITATVWISDGIQRDELTIPIFVNDINDLSPVFSEESYDTTIVETTLPGTTVFSNIEVNDPDSSGNSQLEVTCDSEGSNRDTCNVFNIEVTQYTNRRWIGNIILFGQLDYESKTFYQMTLLAYDGQYTTRKNLNIAVTDIQDEAPVFNRDKLSAVIDEQVSQGSPVLTVEATDGDASRQRSIVYKLISNPGGLFAIGRETGIITATQNLDRSNPYLSQGFVNLEIEANEIIEGTVESTDPQSITRAVALISFTDVNNNGPVISPASNTVIITENLAPGTTLSETLMTVTDADQGLNARFELLLDNDSTYTSLFEVVPSTGSGTAQVAIRYKQGTLDYDLGRKQYDLRVVARETDTVERRSAVAMVTIQLKDVNDNAPQFSLPGYEASVIETAPEGTFVITITATDLDEGPYGTPGVRYKLSGDGSRLFKVDPITGRITVRQCDTPGQGSCLDYEQVKKYELTFIARDSYGEGLETRVPLVISITDDNDNSPIFALRNYTSFIDEGQTIPRPPVTVQAFDDDGPVNSQIIYTIVGGNIGNIWQLNPTTGYITANRPVQYEETPGANGYYHMTVQASDNKYSTTADVWIFVNDGNDHPPTFNPSSYTLYIPEETPPGTSIVSVTAIDLDPITTANGQIRYSISTGDQGQFVIGETSGMITVAPNGQFDYDLVQQYNMIVLARDQGSPQMTGTASVTVIILDSNNQIPYFEPSTVSVDVLENAQIGFPVITMQAIDPDSSATLQYQMIQPIYGWDKNGLQVNPTDPGSNYVSMFSIQPNSGVVQVSSTLNRDSVARVSATIQATDISGGPDQTALATLIINILDVNNQPPIFPPPWLANDPQNQYMTIQVTEGQPIGYYVMTLVATDPDGDGINNYVMTSNPGGYFAINEATGVVTIARELDYELIENVEFVVAASDRGDPPLTSTITVKVDVININDENPTFSDTSYTANIPENAPQGFTVTTITATDLDKGDYGVIRYRLDDPLGRFTIDPVTGVVTVADPTTLDRETAGVVTLTVQAYDSPNDPNTRRTEFVTLRVYLDDVNDNTPIFVGDPYIATIPESHPIGGSVVTVSATDPDDPQNTRLTYTIIDGNTNGFFTIDPNTGEITVDRSVDGYPGVYTVTVQVSDNGIPTPMTAQTSVIITVEGANNEPPTWIVPATNNDTVAVIEGQYPGIEVITVLATDADAGPDGEVTYGFYVNGFYTTQTPEFYINTLTGIISANVTFDRETKDTYTLLLVARDSGQPQLESTRYLTVTVNDINDNNPVFPTFANCCSIPYEFEVRENQAAGIRVGQVSATDLDLGTNANIQYILVGGNEGDSFRINQATGEISTKKVLDAEVTSVYNLLVRAIHPTDNPIAVTPDPTCDSNCDEPSVVTVIVGVTDENDSPPTFSARYYNACIAEDAPLNKSVTTVHAFDYDSVEALIYSLNGIQSALPAGSSADLTSANGNEFIIMKDTGTIYSNAIMSPVFLGHYFTLNVYATDPGNLQGTAIVQIWVTEPAYEMRITVRKTVDEVKQEIGDIVQWIKDEAGPSTIVCVNDIRYHLTDEFDVNRDWTDIIVHIVDGETKTIYPPNEIIDIVWPPSSGQVGLVDSISVTSIQPSYAAFGGFTEDWVLIPVILVILLLLLLCPLLCCLCWLLGICPCCKKKSEKSTYLASDAWLIAGGGGGSANPIIHELETETQELNLPIGATDKGEFDSIRLAGHINEGFGIVDDDHDWVGNGISGGALTTANSVGTLQMQNDLGERRIETTNEYQMNYEHTTMRTEAYGGGDGHLALDNGYADSPRIVADLEPSTPDSVFMSNTLDRRGRSMSNTQPRTPRRSGSVPAVNRHSSHNAIGATLHRSELDLPDVSYVSLSPHGPSSPHSATSPRSFQGGAVNYGFSSTDDPLTTWPRGYGAGQYVEDGPFHPEHLPNNSTYHGEIILDNVQPPRFASGSHSIHKPHSNSLSRDNWEDLRTPTYDHERY